MTKITKHQPEQDDLSYWESSRSGDSSAFSYLFKKYYKPLYHFAGRFVKDIQIAEQISQSVFVDLWVKRQHLEIRSSFKSYLYQMTRNLSLNHLKKAVKTIPLENAQNFQEKAEKNPENILVEKEFQLAVHQAIEKLPAQCRQVYIMKRYDHLKSDEIARILNISVNTVKTHMRRALKSLLEQLTPNLKNY
jgi:RNA polymerase sigma-70 factor (ECF subfamily)